MSSGTSVHVVQVPVQPVSFLGFLGEGFSGVALNPGNVNLGLLVPTPCGEIGSPGPGGLWPVAPALPDVAEGLRDRGQFTQVLFKRSEIS